MRKKSYILFLLSMLVASSMFAQSAVESKLSKDSILIGDQIVWNTEFVLPNNTPLQILPYTNQLQQDTNIRNGVEVVRDFIMDTLSFKEGKQRLSAKVLLTSFDSGSYILPSPIIIFQNQSGGVDTLKIDPQKLYVDNIQIDTATFVPFDIKEAIKYPFSFKQILPWLIAVAIVALLIFLLWKYLKYRKDLKEGKYSEPPHITALKKLDKLRSDKLWQSGREKSYYSGITDTLKEYIDKSYGIGAVEMTSSEIMNSLKDREIEPKLYGDMGEMFTIADLVKFAKQSPQPIENEKSIQTAINFVNYSYMRQLEAEKEAVKAQDAANEQNVSENEAVESNTKKGEA